MNYVDADYIFEYGTKGEVSFVPTFKSHIVRVNGC